MRALTGPKPFALIIRWVVDPYHALTSCRDFFHTARRRQRYQHAAARLMNIKFAGSGMAAGSRAAAALGKPFFDWLNPTDVHIPLFGHAD